MSDHRCHARRCETVIPPRLLFCQRHWAMTPLPLRRAIWREYRDGQEIDKQPSEAYLAVMMAAIDAVARREDEER